MSARTKLLLKCNEPDCESIYEGPWRADDADSDHSAWKSGWIRLGLRRDDRHRCPECASLAVKQAYAEKLARGKR